MEMPKIRPEFKGDLNIMKGDLTPARSKNYIALIAGRSVRKLEAGVQKLDHFIKTSNWESKQTRSLNQLEKHFTSLDSALKEVNSQVSKHEKTDKLMSDHNHLNKDVIEQLKKMEEICIYINRRPEKVDVTKLEKVQAQIIGLISTCEKDIETNKLDADINKLKGKLFRAYDALENFRKDMKGNVDIHTKKRFSDFNKETLKELGKIKKVCKELEKNAEGKDRQKEISVLKDHIQLITNACEANIRSTQDNSRTPEEKFTFKQAVDHMKPKAELEKLGDLSFSDMPELKVLLSDNKFNINDPKHIEFFKKTIMNRAQNGHDVVSELKSLKLSSTESAKLLPHNEFFDYAKAQVKFGGPLKGCVGLENTRLEQAGNNDQLKIDLLKEALTYRKLSAEDVRYFINAMNIRNSPDLPKMLEDQGFTHVLVVYDKKADVDLEQNKHLIKLTTPTNDPRLGGKEYVILKDFESGKLKFDANKKSVFG